MSLPGSLTQAICNTLRTYGDNSPLVKTVPIGGGDINLAAYIISHQQPYFVKWHNSPPQGFFEDEAQGLARLAEAGCVRVPLVVGWGCVPDSTTCYLILEWIERENKNDKSAEDLGRNLARQHLVKQSEYGLDHDNFIGRLPQPNRLSNSWLEFYQTQRLGVQRDLAMQQGRLPAHRAHLLDRLIETLDEWIDEDDCRPSLLHGDLWGGNWMTTTGGEPVIFDPAVYVGCREADLAMTTLFGGFPRTFYDAYSEVFPLQNGYEERQPLYQLYYLLCHLNLFGEGYGGSVDDILRRYVCTW
ncbi:MAG: fructosamine kinase family protein [Anaerolineae bacterium]|nr:fructosamine kinase family protein [Anaerolineae bacterium]